MNLSNIPVFKKKTYAKAPELSGEGKERHSFIIVGSGLIGLAVALDLARKGHAVILVTAYDFIAAGSKAICFAKQSLDIFDRLGVGAEIVARGVIWNIGKVYQGEKEEPIYQFDMLPEKNQKNPAFINIPQYSAEDIMIDALERMDNVEIRWGHQVKDIDVHGGAATLFITTRDGDYTLETDYVLACDGSHSKVRECLQLDFQGRVFEDNFLIVDVKFQHESPSERKFWFDPPFNRGRTALLHKQPDDIWRLDFQLGWDIDRAEVMKPENVAPYIKGMLGDDLEYEIEWLSVYTFQCRRMENFVHGPVIFVGDSAHLVSPFGARGANGGFSDAENIAWKLDFVIRGTAPCALLESYNDERTMGADENILHSTRATDFLTPKNAISTAFRDAVLDLAGTYAFARPFVNSGRLSTPTPYYNSQLSTPDGDDWQGKGPAPGHPCIDAPLSCDGREGWLLEMLGGSFTVLNFGNPEEALLADVDVRAVAMPRGGLAAERYGACDGATYLVRPDQVVAARWKVATALDITNALKTALAQERKQA